MTPRQRSTLQLDLKDLTPRQSTPLLRHLGLASVTLGALVGTYVLLNAPSASTGEDTVRASTDISADLAGNLATVVEMNTTDPLASPGMEEAPDGIELMPLTPSPAVVRTITSGDGPLNDNIGHVQDLDANTSPVLSADTGRPSAPFDSFAADQLSDIAPAEPVSKGPVPGEEAVVLPVDFTDPAALHVASLGLPNTQPSLSAGQNGSLFGNYLHGDFDLFSRSLGGADDEPQPVQAVVPDFDWTTARVKKKDTLSKIFERHGVKIRDAYRVAELEDAAVLLKIRPGQEVHLARGEAGAFSALRYDVDTFTSLYVIKEGENEYRTETITRDPEIRVRAERATIWTSLLGAAEKADIDYDTVYEMIRIFGWQVDFAREIQSGDQFTVIFEELYLDDRKVGYGDVLAAELVTGNEQIQAVRHVDENGNVNYYTPEGEGIQGSFLRNPVKFGRVTSRFTSKRYHPVLKKWRAHKGVDYGAPRGTPILATGNGVVKFAGRNKGYGKVVELRHGGTYTTLYAHMDGFAKGIKSGARVQQGQVIGYVGKTGLATGTHLHYEFRVNGVHRNPQTVKLPKSAPIDRKYRKEFLADAGKWTAQLDDSSRIAVAQLDEPL